MDYYMELPLDELVTSDDFHPEFRAKLEDPDETDEFGNTLLHMAASSRTSTARNVELLIARGLSVDSTNIFGHTPLHVAVCSRKRETVLDLIEAGVSVNTKDILGRTALHFSVCKGKSYRLGPIAINDCDMWIVEKLSSHPDICLDPVDHMGETPLVWAVKEKNSNALRTLLQKRVYSEELLHVALSDENPSYDIVDILILYGADIYHEDTSQQTPLDILVRSVCPDDDETLRFAKRVVRLIALRCHIRDCLWHKLKQIPDLYHYFGKCFEEVSLMRKQIVCDKFNLHDFCLDCFQTRSNPEQKIYKPVIEMLLTGAFQIYKDLVWCRLFASIVRVKLPWPAGKKVGEYIFS